MLRFTFRRSLLLRIQTGTWKISSFIGRGFAA